MVDYHGLMKFLSIPRPCGSQAERQTHDALVGWISQRGIPYRVHTFRLYPHFFLAIGVWLILSRTALAAAVWGRWGWLTALIALIGLLGGLVDVVFNFPLVSWPGAVQGKNILIEIAPPDPQQEIILSAHYDTKTELLDHRRRLFFLKNLDIGILLTLTLGLLGVLDGWFLSNGSPLANTVYGLGVVLSLAMLFLAWGLGLNLVFGRLRQPSQGAVDNGAACAILCSLAAQFHNGNARLQHTKLTLALFTGEEVNMQGSYAYASSRDWSLPSIAVNLEVMAQNGDYVLWEYDGTSLKLLPTSRTINETISGTIEELTGSPALYVGPVNSDGGSFLRFGLPATTIGTYDRVLRDRGFHCASDNTDRVDMARLPEAVEILSRFVIKYDHGELKFPAE